ncbi:Tyrosine-protein phosphatase 69D [Aphelenchoides fujianensis]|nr:Tyrosine-protein phosphatase 69D [Aphelenchoides fujianensis]
MGKSEKKEQEMLLVDVPNPFFRGLTGRWNKMVIRRRMRDDEWKTSTVFVNQMVGRIASILVECEKRRQMVDFLFHDGELRSHLRERDEIDVLVARYGERMGAWLDEIYFSFPEGKITTQNIRQHFDADSPVALAHALQRDAEEDELRTWFSEANGNAHRTMERIQGFAEFVCSMLRFSPGKPKTDLREFFVEFEILENFFDNVELEKEELSQKGFDSNYLAKARSKNVVCGELNRVLLMPLEGGPAGEQTLNGTAMSDVRLFDDIDGPETTIRDTYGTGDFIHANRIFGGPLKNTFILTQSPLPHTIADFWRMVWQEKSKYIFMLCGCIDVNGMALLGSAKPNGCPALLAQTLDFGPFVIRNESLDMTVDPLFEVSSLSIWLAHDPSNVHFVEHWQWDWTEFDDFRWPLRLLRRSRIEHSPTIVHCLDGCGRSGTLVLIETMIMQLLRGTNNFANPMLTSGVFLRLQRRHAVGNSLQYLFAYRCVLQWCQPYVLSTYQRLLLGFYFNNSGFCGKFDEIAASYTRKGKLRV